MQTRARIAFVELWRLGDAIAATAGLQALASARPDADLAIVAHPSTGDPLFRLLPQATRIPFAAFWTRGKVARDKYVPWTIDYRDLARVRHDLRRFSPDVYLMFRGDIREHLFFSIAYRAEIVDLGSRAFVPWVRTISSPKGLPRFREYVHLVREWSRSPASGEPSLANVPASQPGEEPFVLVHPGATWRFKQWSDDSFATVIRRLGTLGIPVKLIGSPSDAPAIERILGRLEAPVEVVWSSLEQFYATVAAARLVICNNSAALHVAEALNTPCIAITGPNDPVRWGTYRPHSRTLQRSVGLSCHPCREKRCVRPDAPCIDYVTPDDVLRAVAEILQ